MPKNAKYYYEEAVKAALRYQEIFGKGNFFLELQDHGIPEQTPVNQGIMRLARETGLPLVVTNDAHYLRKEDAQMQDVLLCIQTGKTVDEPNRMKFQTEEFYLKSEEEMRLLFPNCPEAFENTQKIADRCNLEFVFNQYHLPSFPVPEGYTTEEATYAVNNCGANWKEQAAKSAKSYLDIMSFSRQGLYDQLEFEGFTAEEAAYGVEEAYK